MFRDLSYVKNIATLGDTKEVSEDACRMILSDMELKLRFVIKESLKFMKLFKRDYLTNVDINCALENLRMGGKMVGMRETYTNQYTLGEDNKWYLENKVLVIQEHMKEVEFDHFMNRHPIELTWDWLSVGGNLLNSSANSGIVCLADTLKPPTKLPFFDTKIKPEINLIREPQPNILSKEADKFLNSFFRILKENLEHVRSPNAKANFARFVQGSHHFHHQC